MELRLGFVCLACILSFATGGCMKAGPPAGVPTVFVAVAAVDGPALAVLGPSAAPHPAAESDGFTTGDRVEIEWQGSWLPATLVERRSDRWLVRYEAGEGDSRESAEETVERERIRVPVAPSDDEVGDVDVDP